MAEILRRTDRWGRDIVLHEVTWYDKIASKHVEVDGQIDAIMATLMEPDRVNYDSIYPDGENYYRLAIRSPPYHRIYLKVVVRFQRIDNQLIGKGITAYPSPYSAARGERHKWHR